MPLAIVRKPRLSRRAQLFSKIMQRIDGLVGAVTNRTGIATEEKIATLASCCRWCQRTGCIIACVYRLSNYCGLHNQTNWSLYFSKATRRLRFSFRLISGPASFSIRSVTAPAQPSKSYELWIVNDKLGAPRSLGGSGYTRCQRASGAGI